MEVLAELMKSAYNQGECGF